MENKKRFSCANFDFSEKFFECPRCGNHVCAEQAELWNRICPNCFGRLYRIS